MILGKHMSETSNNFKITTPRDTVQVTLNDGRVIEGPRGACIAKFLRVLPEWTLVPVVGAVVNGELRELTFPVDMDARCQPVTMSDADGARIYRRSLIFLLQAAFADLYPSDSLTVDHSVASGGYFCQVFGGGTLSQTDLVKLKERMRELVEADLPFERRLVPLSEAVALFEKTGQDDKVRLLKYRPKDHLVIYRLGRHQDYHHGYMVPSSGYLKWFDLSLLGDGFVLQYPRRHSPTALSPMPEYPKLLSTFRQYGRWLESLGIDSVGALNDGINSGRAREIILVSEALHEQKIADIARQIADNRDRVKVVLIAGPSSSGKTTFSKRLSVQLLARGIAPYPIEMDNYFLDREKTPRDENGDYDFESIEALNTGLLGQHLNDLIAGHEVQLRHYNFKTGINEPGEVVQLKKDQLIILEGIHGLNSDLLPGFDSRLAYRVYVSCLTQLNLDRHNRISTTDTRLLRRIVRDSRERGYSALATISRWESVRRGEKDHIFPYQENADEFFNSALVYELSALKPLAEPLLRQVPYSAPEHIEAKRLLAFLEWFLLLPEDLIPDNSILREFLGGSILRDFKLWESN